MFKPLELFIGLRYTRARRRGHTLSFNSIAAILGIALGVTAMITVMSVMNGFQKEVRERMLDMVAHLTVADLNGRMSDWTAVTEVLDTDPEVAGTAPYVHAEGMLINRGEVNGAFIRGVLPDYESKVSNIPKHMEQGSLGDLKSGEFNIILGRDLAQKLGVLPGEKVTLVTPNANVTAAGITPRLKRFTVSGIFFAGHNIYDSSLAIVHLDDARKLFRLQNDVSGVRIRLHDFSKAQVFRENLVTGKLAGYWVRDWGMIHQNWFRAVQIEKRMIFFLMMLIFVVAATNVVSMLVMVVKDKESDIAILRTLGASPRSIMGTFIVQGTIIGTIGTVLGVLGGISLAKNIDAVVAGLEKLFGFHVLDPGIYYISELPSDLHWSDVWVITVFSFLIGMVATIYPAWRASRTQPVEALRYE
jgi:lipoprotein-releasing system permease protein